MFKKARNKYIYNMKRRAMIYIGHTLYFDKIKNDNNEDDDRVIDFENINYSKNVEYINFSGYEKYHEETILNKLGFFPNLQIIEFGCDNEFIIPDFIYKHKNTLKVLKIIGKTISFTDEFYELTNLEIIFFSNFDVNKFGKNLKKLINLKKINIYKKEDENTMMNDDFYENLPPMLNDVTIDLESSRKILKESFNNIFYCLTNYLNDKLELLEASKIKNLLIDNAYIEYENYLCINCYVYEYLGKNKIKIPEYITKLILLQPHEEIEHNVPHNIEHLKIAIDEVYKWDNLPPTLKILEIYVSGKQNIDEIMNNIKLPFNCKLKIFRSEAIVPSYLDGRLDGKYNPKYTIIKLEYSK